MTRTRLQLSQKLSVSGVMKPSRPPSRAHRNSAPGRRSRTRTGQREAPSRAARFGQRQELSNRSPSTSPSGMTSMKVNSMPRPCAQATSRTLAVVEAFQRDRINLDLQAGGVGGVDPSHHLVEVAPASDSAELVGSSVSSETLMRRTPHRPVPPHSAQLRAVGGQRQLVERPQIKMPRQRTEQPHESRRPAVRRR